MDAGGGGVSCASRRFANEENTSGCYRWTQETGHFATGKWAGKFMIIDY